MIPMARRSARTAAVITSNCTKRVGLGIEIQYDRLASEIGQADGMAVLVGQLEVGSRIAG